MASSNDGNGGDRKVGKGKPPPQHRFKPGQSGNPKGRPRKKRIPSTLELLDPHVATVVAHIEGTIERRTPNGKVERVSRYDLALDSLFRQAAKGDLRATNDYLAIGKAAKDAARDAREEQYLHASSYRGRWLLEFVRADAEGKELPKIYPDPRDIILHPDLTVEIVGPINEEQHIVMMEALRRRDLALKLLDITKGRIDDALTMYIENALRDIELCNAMLPPRLRKFPPAPISGGI